VKRLIHLVTDKIPLREENSTLKNRIRITPFLILIYTEKYEKEYPFIDIEIH
jgi:hypothetical protein